MFLNIAKYFKTVGCGCGAVAGFFFNLLKTSTVADVFVLANMDHLRLTAMTFLNHKIDFLLS